MRKEAIFAILIGVVVGLGITYGIYRVRQIITPPPETLNNNESTNTQNSIIDDSAEEISEKLFVTVPADESITDQESTTISGTAEPNEVIVILIHDDQYVTSSDEIGAFAQQVKLEKGGNLVSIVAITSDGKQKKKQIFIARETIQDEKNVESTSSAETKEET